MRNVYCWHKDWHGASWATSVFKNARFGIRVDSSATLCVSGRLALNGNSTWRPNVTRGGWYLTTDKILTNQVEMLENLYESPIKRNMSTFNHSKWYGMFSIQSIPRKNSCYWVCSLGPGWWGLFFGNSLCYSPKKKHPFKNPATSPRNKRILLKIWECLFPKVFQKKHLVGSNIISSISLVEGEKIDLAASGGTLHQMPDLFQKNCLAFHSTLKAQKPYTSTNEILLPIASSPTSWKPNLPIQEEVAPLSQLVWLDHETMNPSKSIPWYQSGLLQNLSSQKKTAQLCNPINNLLNFESCSGPPCASGW